MQKGSEENLAGNASEIVGISAILSNSVVLSDWTKLTIDFTNIFCNNWQRLNSRNGLWVVYNRRVKHNRPGFLIKDFLKHVENKWVQNLLVSNERWVQNYFKIDVEEVIA